MVYHLHQWESQFFRRNIFHRNFDFILGLNHLIRQIFNCNGWHFKY